MSEIEEPVKPAASKGVDAPVRKELDDVLGNVHLQARIEQMESRLKQRDDAEVASILDSSFKDAVVREVVAKVVNGKSPEEARLIIKTIHDVSNKVVPATPGAAIPAAVGGGEKPIGYFDDGYKHQFIDNRKK